MSRSKTPSHTISGLFVFMLLGIFAVCATVMVLLGAKSYRGTAERAGIHNNGRIASAYVRSMLRADDEASVLKLETVEGVETIALLNVYDEEAYITRIYVQDGMLREWFTEAEEPFVPEDGEAVCALDEMTAQMEDGLLVIRMRSGEQWSDVRLALRAAAL